MSTSNINQPPQNTATEAVEWFITLQAANVSREHQENFADWLQRSPVHVEEFLQLTAVHGDLSRLPELRDADIDAELVKLKSQSVSDNVVALNLNSAQISQKLSRPGARRKLFLTAVAATAIAAIGLWTSGTVRDFFNTQHYKTDIGEQRSLTLVDGSQIQLNALSNLSATLNETVRQLELTDGEALFRVAKDPSRTFRVRTPQAVIEAKGTQFNVHVAEGKTVVSLIEGHVLVTPPADANGHSAGALKPVLLNPGQKIVVSQTASDLPTPRSVDPKTAIAWTEHRLIFEDAPLSEVIAEFNRYSHEPFTIEDPVLRNTRITASFDANSTRTFADTLSATSSLRITRQPSGGWLIERK